MGSNQRKVYDPDGGANGEPEACPRCGCRHRYTVRASADQKNVKIKSICRFCGFETVENA